MRIASPPGYGPTDADLERLLAAGLAEAPFVTTRPAEAAKGADAVHTDVWASMGQEAEAEARRRAFEGFTVDDARASSGAGRAAIFLHCLPAHRGEEVVGVGRRRARRAGCSRRPTTACTPSGACSASCSRRR